MGILLGASYLTSSRDLDCTNWNVDELGHGKFLNIAFKFI